jgi:hypothetical protein
LATIFSSVVNSDSNGFGELDTQSNGFNLSKSEALAQSGSVTVSNGLASDSGSEPIEGTGRDSDSFGSPGLKSRFLAAGLVEPNSDVTLPMFAKVDVGDHVVMLNHLPITKVLYLIN